MVNYSGSRRTPAIDNKYYSVNHKIKDRELRVITGDGENLGVIKTEEALKVAIEKGLDLVVVSPNAVPPVAKILDFKKFLYQERKEKTKAKIRSKKTDTKEIMFKPFTAEGDLNWQIGRAKEWITEGNRVKVWVAMKGRSAAHPEISMDKIQKFVTELSSIAKAESEPEKKGNIISVMFIPR
jgi:translation initiation factor IF-3